MTADAITRQVSAFLVFQSTPWLVPDAGLPLFTAAVVPPVPPPETWLAGGMLVADGIAAVNCGGGGLGSTTALFTVQPQ